MDKFDKAIESLQNIVEYVNNPATTAEARRFIAMLQAENSKLLGVMHSVDKWLDDDELKQDEVNRAATMREKVLRIIERLQAENSTLKRTLELACDYLADNNASRVDWQKHFMELAKEESENGH